jgi:hypothetical protein
MFEEYNIFPRNEYVHSDSESISNFKEDGSTYMGVKTIQEGTVADTNKKDLQKEKNEKNEKYSKFRKKKKKKKSSSFSESSSSSSFSESDIFSNDNIIIEHNIDNDEKKQKVDLKLSNIEPKPDININKDNNIRTEFYWDEGGNEIYITGSFCEWKDFFLMEKNEKGIYTKILMLPPGFYQYKFKIDNNWAYSQKQPKFEDNNGNVNNFIDTTNYNQNMIQDKQQKKKEDKKENIEKTKKFRIDNIKEPKYKINNIKRNPSTKSTNSIGIYSDYSTYIPLKTELSIKPSALPGLYKTHYNLNEKKNKIIYEKKFSQIEYIDHTNNLLTNQYVGFQNLYHIHSNHLHSKEISDTKNNVTSIISRYRAKFSTFIYYKEKKQKKLKYIKTTELKEGVMKKIVKYIMQI